MGIPEVQAEGECDFSFPCSDYHAKCQASYDKIRAELKRVKLELKNQRGMAEMWFSIYQTERRALELACEDNKWVADPSKRGTPEDYRRQAEEEK